MNDAFFKIFNVDPLSSQEFNSFAELFKKISGINLKIDKKGLIESRLRKRFLTLQKTPSEYLRLLETSPSEINEFITALTTHKTDWMREPIHFNIVEKYIKNQILKSHNKHNPNTSFSCWSAACSTGEEVYSLAMTLNQISLNFNNWTILGSDISTHCVEHAKDAIYDKASVDSQLRPELIKRFFLTNLDPKYKGFYRFTPEFEDKIKIIEFNLVKSKFQFTTKFDIIFLRNVLIYFDKNIGAKIISSVLEYLRPGGLLILGLSESLPNPEHYHLKRLESSVYTR